MNLNQVTIHVTDVERSIAFYENLGLTLIVKSLPDYARFHCLPGAATFSLHKTAYASKAESAWIYFEIDNLDEKVALLLKKGYVFEELPNEKPWLWKEARLKDPDNNQLILYYAGENRTNPPWKVK